MRRSLLFIAFLSAVAVVPAPVADAGTPSADPVVEKVTAPKRQARKKALRVRVALTRAAEITIRMRQTDEEIRWRPLRMKGHKGANPIRITAGKDKKLPTGRYRLKVSARAGERESKVWKLSVRVVKASRD